jgi:hypothetical protein
MFDFAIYSAGERGMSTAASRADTRFLKSVLASLILSLISGGMCIILADAPNQIQLAAYF